MLAVAIKSRPTAKLHIFLLLALTMPFSVLGMVTEPPLSLPSPVHIKESCQVISPVFQPYSARLPLKVGKNEVVLACNWSSSKLLHFTSNVVNKAEAFDSFMQPLRPISSADYAFFIADGPTTITVNIYAQAPRHITFSVSSLYNFHTNTLVHALTIAAFLGFCFALCIYVGMVGKGLKEYGFYAYSGYILSASLFFLMQEKLLHILFPDIPLLKDYFVAVSLAGLTVLTATRFISTLLDLESLLERWFYRTIQYAALTVFILSVVPLFIQTEWSVGLHQPMGLITFGIILALLGTTVWATTKGVNSAGLVLLSMIIMAIAMFFRLFLDDFNPFIARYSLIFAITIESLVLAIAVSEKVKYLQDEKIQALHMAATDDLCPVLNRRGWQNAARLRLDELETRPGMLLLMYIDLDKFKQVNDTFSHAVGDKTLIQVANLLKYQSRPQDLVGRLGGDEFVVLTHCHSEGQAQRLVENLQNRLALIKVNVDEIFVTTSASVGYQLIHSPDSDLDVFLHRSDLEMYKQKEARQSASPA